MAGNDDKRKLIKLARRGPLEGDTGFKAKLKELVERGIQGPGRDYGLDYCDKPFYRSALWEATWKNNEATVKLLIEKGATVDFPDYQYRTPLHEAAYYGHMNLVQLFLQSSHPIDPIDVFGQTPLHRAVEAGRNETINYLVEQKAQTNLMDCHGITIQHQASFVGASDMSTWLLYNGSWKNQYEIREACGYQPPYRAATSAATGVVYLPKKLHNVVVLKEEEEGVWKADNTFLKSTAPGLGYCNSRSANDRAKALPLKWGDTVEGQDDGPSSNWVVIRAFQPPPGGWPADDPDSPKVVSKPVGAAGGAVGGDNDQANPNPPRETDSP